MDSRVMNPLLVFVRASSFDYIMNSKANHPLKLGHGQSPPFIFRKPETNSLGLMEPLLQGRRGRSLDSPDSSNAGGSKFRAFGFRG